MAYPAAISFFDAYQSSSACSASCQSATTAIEAQALFQYGTQLLNQGNFSAAITQFETVTTKFATSSYAAQAHEAAAQAYLNVGKQEVASECPAPLPYGQSPAGALATYKTLSTTYADTPEGQQAKTALAAPQDAVGHFLKAVQNSKLFLSKHLNLSAGTESDDYTAKITSSSTTFTFTKVALGSYYLTFVDSGGNAYYIGALNKPTAFPIGPLCATDLGTLQN